MAVKVAINGFGRIGRLVLRAIIESGRTDVVPVAINDLGSVEANAHLFRFDSVVTSRQELLIVMTPHILRSEVDAEAYSLGQSSDAGGPEVGTPTTFALAFAGIGGTPLSSISIVKDAGAPNAQDFDFTTTGTGLDSFTLDDDDDGRFVGEDVRRHLEAVDQRQLADAFALLQGDVRALGAGDVDAQRPAQNNVKGVVALSRCQQLLAGGQLARLAAGKHGQQDWLRCADKQGRGE